MKRLTDRSFDGYLKTHRAVLVDFTAPWCGPCRMMAPVLARVAERYRGRAGVASVSIDRNPALVVRFDVLTIPSMRLFVDGAVVSEITGACSRTALERMIDAALARRNIP